MSDVQSIALSFLFLLGLLVGYICIPFFPVKFLCLAGAAYVVLHVNIDQRDLWLLLAAFIYAFSFLLTPFSAYLFTSPGHFSWSVFITTQLGIAAMGGLWLYAVGRRSSPAVADGRSSVTVFAIYTGVFVLLYLPSWTADIPYEGDEIYHILAIAMTRVFCNFIFGQWQGLLMAIVGLAAVTYSLHYNTCRWTERGYRPCAKAERMGRGTYIPFFLLLAAAFYLPCAYIGDWMSWRELIEFRFLQEQMVRYPNAQAWISTLLGRLCYENWSGSWIANEICRFLPLLSIFILGLVLTRDRRWQKTTAIFLVLAVLGIVTIPNLFYHGTIVYLELPVVLLMCLVLADSKNLLTGRHLLPWKQTGWWALVLLPMAKETALPIVLIVIGMRMLFQCRIWPCPRAGAEALPLVKEEGWIWMATLFPCVLYFAMRHRLVSLYQLPARAYAGNFANLADISCWWQAFFPLWYQFGAILLLAGYGLWVLSTKREWEKVILTLSSFVAIKIFFICDSQQWIGLARFNLLALPPVIVLGWEGMTDLIERSPRIGRMIPVILLAANLALSPVNYHGERGDWGNSPERWYPFSMCFGDIRNATDSGKIRILLGNMAYKYGIPAITERLEWYPHIEMLSPYCRGIENLEKTLYHAQKMRYDVVVYRNEEDLVIPDGYVLHGFVKTKKYRAAVGSLLVFFRQAIHGRGF